MKLLACLAGSVVATVGIAPGNATDITVTLRPDPSKLAELERVVVAAASPESATYGTAFTLADLSEYVGATDQDKQAVVAAIQKVADCSASSVQWLSDSRDILVARNCSAAVSLDDVARSHPRIQIAFETQDWSRQPSDAAEAKSASNSPQSAQSTQSQQWTADENRSADPNKCENETNVTPEVMHTLYSVPTQTGPCKANPRGQAVAMDTWTDSAAKDLQTFFRHFAPNMEGQTLAHVYGDVGSSGSGTEDKLDVQWAMSMGQFVPTSFYTQAMQNFTNWLVFVNSMERPPLVHSVSASWQMTALQREQWNVELVKAAARRLTVMVSSGDSGCLCDFFQPDKLTYGLIGSPYVTSVGGTQLKCLSNESHSLEEAWDGSTGGFNPNYATPTWQRSAVLAYLNNTPSSKRPNNSWFNTSARGLPDVALLAQHTVVVDGVVNVGAGTSVSSPAFAGLISLLNNARLSANKTAMGMLGPFMYSNPDAFQDITSGRTGDGNDCPAYQAVPGWDPATGLGSPNFTALLAAAMDLP